jgi:hypothetical protein
MSDEVSLVEKVAGAIAHARSWQTTALTVGDWDDRSKAERKPFLDLAQAALDATPLVKMRGALEELSSEVVRSFGVINPERKLGKALANARAALSSKP